MSALQGPPSCGRRQSRGDPEIGSAKASICIHSEAISAGDEHRFFGSSQAGRPPASCACDPLGEALLGRALRR
jgi:hypothetical protein